METTLSRLPLAFERNEGQTDARVRYVSRGRGFSLFLTGDEAVLRLQGGGGSEKVRDAGATVRMRLQGANSDPVVEPEAQLPGRSHYYLGNDASAWRRSVERFARVRYQEVYDGVDLVYYGREGELEYDYVVRPGADPDQIRMQITGAEGARLSPEGDLLLQTAAGELRQQRPFVYQETGGVRKQVPGRYLLADAGSAGEVGVRFELGSYDRDRALVIDPVLSYSTYLGGSGVDFGIDIEVDAQGYMYVTGRTTSVNFPVANPLQGFAGGSGQTSNEGTDTFVTKLTPNGDALVYSTYLGGNGLDWAQGLSLDADQNVYLTGQTSSSNFPVQAALQPQSGGGWDAFVTRLDSAGLLVFSTYLGGSSTDMGGAVLHDGQGNVFLGGTTFSFNFPTLNALQPTHANVNTPTAALEDAFVAKLGADGANLQFSTYLGASLRDSCVGLALDPSGNLCIGGDTTSTNFPVTSDARQPVQAGRTDAFYTKLSADGSVRLYSTYFGGNFEDRLHGFGVDAQGSVYLSGFTFSTNLPTTFGAISTVYQGGNSDGFLAKLNAAGNAYVYVTYLGGSGSIEYAYDVAPEASGNVYVAGTTDSFNFPQTDPFQGFNQSQNAFVMRLNPTGQRIYSTYLTGMSDNAADYAYAIAADANGNAYVTGRTHARNWPLVNPLQSVSGGVSAGDAFIAKLSPLHTVAPGLLQCRANTPYEAGLSWTDQSNNEAGFSLERSTNAVNYTVIATLPANTTSYADPGRNPGSTYWYRLRGFNTEGYTDYTSNAVTMPTDPPPAPTNLTVTAISSTVLRLTWVDNSSNETRFDVTRSHDGGANYGIIQYLGPNVTSYDDQFLAPDTVYHYIVYASNSNANTASNVASGRTLPNPPAAPNALVAAAASASQANLSWADASTNEAGFRIERASNGGAFVQIAEVAANVTAYVDSGLTSNLTYTYRVRSFNAGGNSAYSAAASALTHPAAPSNLTGQAPTGTRIELTWTDNNVNPAQSEVERSVEGAAFARIATTAAGTSAYTDTDVQGGTTYRFRVRSVNASGASPYTDVVAVTTPLDPPAAPVNLVAVAASASQINLSWADASTNEAGFRIERASNGGAFVQIAEVAANATAYADSGLSGNVTYVYRVRSFNAGGSSAYTAAASALTYPSAPSGLSGQAPSGTRVELSWTDTNANPAQSEVERSADGGATFIRIATVAAGTGTYADTDVQNEKTYQYRVRSVNATGASAYSDVAAVTTPLDPPAAPESLSAAYNPVTRRVDLNWIDRSSNEAGFHLERSADGGANWSLLANPGPNSTSFSDLGWQPDATHSYRVRAFNPAGASAFSNLVTLSMPPAAPTNLTAQAGSAGQILLAWTDNSVREDAYVIERKLPDGTWQQVQVVAAGSTSATDTGLAPDTLYSYRVRARNAVDVSDPSNEASARTLPNPPAAPGGLTVRALVPGELQLTWTDNSTNENGFQVELWGGGQFSLLATVGVDVTTYTHTGLAANTTYTYQVRAFNAGGLSGSTQTVGALTLPSAPANLTVRTVSQTELDLTWTDTNPNPAGHHIERSTDGISFILRQAVGAGTTTFRDSGLLPGTTYHYRVRAANGAGPSPYSNVASGATQAPPPPAAPSNLTGTELSTTQIRLNWRDNSSNESEFRIERSSNGTTFTQIGTAGANTTQFTATGLVKNTRYWFRLRAANAGGVSAYSNIINLRTKNK